MVTRRQQRINQLMRDEIGKMVQHEADDPVLASLISITEVECTQDLQRAKDGLVSRREPQAYDPMSNPDGKTVPSSRAERRRNARESIGVLVYATVTAAIFIGILAIVYCTRTAA